MGITLAVHDVVVLIHPGVGAPSLVIISVAIGQVHVPHHHLETRVHAVAALEELAAQAVGIHVVRQLLGYLVVDEVGHIKVFLIIGFARGPVIPQRGLHFMDAPSDVTHLIGSQILVVGRLVLHVDVSPTVGEARRAHRMILRNIGHLAVGAVHLHDVTAGYRVAAIARIRQIKTLLAIRNHLGEDENAVVDAVKEQLTVASLGRVLHPRA